MTPWTLLALVPVALAGYAVTLLRRRFVVVQVIGTSMTPALRHGDRVLVRRGRGHQLSAGTVAVFTLPLAETAGGWLIKRVAAVHGDSVPESVRPAVGNTAVVPAGMLVVLGDNARSTDSRHWGFVPADQVRGSVVRRLRAGREQQAPPGHATDNRREQGARQRTWPA